MFQGYSNETFEFFMAIRFNNNRPFFLDNRDWYLRAVREPSLALARELADTVEAIDPNLERRDHRVVSRINRDIRFSRDKSPYRDCCWLSFHHTGEDKGKLPGFYFEVRDSGGYYGMGFYRSNKALMDLIRKRILEKPREMLELWLPLEADFHFYGDVASRVSIPESVPPQLRALYDELYPKRDRMPVHQELYKTLKKGSGRMGNSIPSFFAKMHEKSSTR